jgi:hypothetical protein
LTRVEAAAVSRVCVCERSSGSRDDAAQSDKQANHGGHEEQPSAAHFVGSNVLLAAKKQRMVKAMDGTFLQAQRTLLATTVMERMMVLTGWCFTLRITHTKSEKYCEGEQSLEPLCLARHQSSIARRAISRIGVE